MSASVNIREKRDRESMQGEAPAKVSVPLVGEIRDLKESWIASVGEALRRFPLPHFAVLVVSAALVCVAWFILSASQDFTVLRLLGTVLVVLLVVVFVVIVLYMSRKNAEAAEEHPDVPSHARDGH